MDRNELIIQANKVVTNDALTSFISTFSAYDVEIVAIISAWLCNDLEDCSFFARKVVEECMENNPHTFVLTFNSDSNEIGSFYKNLSQANFTNLITLLKTITLAQGGLRNAFDLYLTSPRHKCKYVHDAFALMLGHNTCFPSTNNNGTFFRYNLLFYWLTYRFKIWEDVDYSKALLPCNDLIFLKAKKMGVTKKNMKSSLHNTIKLTNIAKNYFGERDFFKMYELLNYYDKE